MSKIHIIKSETQCNIKKPCDGQTEYMSSNNNAMNLLVIASDTVCRFCGKSIAEIFKEKGFSNERTEKIMKELELQTKESEVEK